MYDRYPISHIYDIDRLAPLLISSSSTPLPPLFTFASRWHYFKNRMHLQLNSALLLTMSLTIGSRTKTAAAALSKSITTMTSVPSSSQLGLKVLSWNIDGLQVDEGVENRLKNIVQEIKACNADVVCLQEVTPMFLPVLRHELSREYLFFPEADESDHQAHDRYFTMILTKATCIEVISYGREQFVGPLMSMMGRDLLSVLCRKVEVKCSSSAPSSSSSSHSPSPSPPPLPPPSPGAVRYSALVLITTSHLESTADGAAPAIRRQQFREILSKLRDNSTIAQIACGDFNLRVSEDKEIRYSFHFI